MDKPFCEYYLGKHISKLQSFLIENLNPNSNKFAKRRKTEPVSKPAVIDTTDPNTSARTRSLDLMDWNDRKAKLRINPPIDAPLEPTAEVFNPNFVPVLSFDKSYKRLSLAMAYRQLGCPIGNGDLVVAKSGIAGYGLFSCRKYAQYELIIEYIGEIIGQGLADLRESRDYGEHTKYRHSCYMFRLDNHRVIDATKIGNAARFINHCCQPNCFTKPVVVEGKNRILIFAKRDIMPGEELSYDYQFAVEDGKDRIPCFCRAKKCRGYMN